MEIASQSVGSAKILVVDDEKVIRDILFDFLSTEGHKVITASSGEEALSRLEKESVDVVLTDLKMPGMSGMDLLEEIKARGIRVCIIIMTGYGTVESAVESIKKGAFDYIQKPFKMKDVETIITRGLKHHRLEEENIRLKEVMNLYKISEAMNSTLSIHEILNIILDTVRHEIDADAVAIWERSGDKKWNKMAELSSSMLAAKEGSDPFGEIRGEEIINNMGGNTYLLASAEEMGPLFDCLPNLKAFSCFLAVPLRARSQITGLVCAYSYGAAKRFQKGHSRVLSVLTDRAGMAIENARLYDQLKNVFQETIQALVTALEAKDPYTSGHTKRVTEYASLIAHGMNLPPEEVEKVTQAALLHDIGKIGIRVSSLNKPEELTPVEYEMFKQHTTQGRLILEPIRFLKDIIPIAESHHERMDGSGYPQGLKGDQISLGARILAVADSFDAMTSDRPYRKSLSRKKAIEELKKYAGSQFDAEVVEVFIRELKKSG